jgi:hypothetical protein
LGYFFVTLAIKGPETFEILHLTDPWSYFQNFFTGNTWFPVGYVTLYLIGHALVLLYRRLSNHAKILLTLVLIPLGNLLYFQLCIPLAQILFHIDLTSQGFINYSLTSLAYLGAFAAGILAYRIQGKAQLIVSLVLAAGIVTAMLFYLLPITMLSNCLAILLFGLVLNWKFSSRAINFIAKYVYDIYLTHVIDHVFLATILGWGSYSFLVWSLESTWGIVAYPLLVLIITFSVGIILGMLREQFFKLTRKLYHHFTKQLIEG